MKRAKTNKNPIYFSMLVSTTKLFLYSTKYKQNKNKFGYFFYCSFHANLRNFCQFAAYFLFFVVFYSKTVTPQMCGCFECCKLFVTSIDVSLVSKCVFEHTCCCVCLCNLRFFIFVFSIFVFFIFFYV